MKLKSSSFMMSRQNKKIPSSQELVDHISHFLDAKKAVDIVVLPLNGKSSIADFLIIASGLSQRHIGSMAEELSHLMKVKYGIKAAIEGLSQSDWVLMDAKDVIVHLFRPEVRAFYNLEKMWALDIDASQQPTDRIS